MQGLQRPHKYLIPISFIKIQTCMASSFRLYAMRLLETALCSEKKRLGMGCLLCGLAMPCFACTLPSLHLVSVDSSAALYPSVVENVLSTCLCASLLYYSTLKEHIIPAICWLIYVCRSCVPLIVFFHVILLHHDEITGNSMMKKK